MSSTRYSQQPLQIYQDPVPFDHTPMPFSKNVPNQKKISPLRSIKDASSRRNIVFNPPQGGQNKRSPLKSQPTSSSPSRAVFGSNKLNRNSIAMPPPGGPLHSTDSMEKKPLMTNFKTGAPQNTLYNTFEANDKENFRQPFYTGNQGAYTGISQSNFSLDGFYNSKPPPKRLLDAAPINEGRSFKKTRGEDLSAELSLEPIELPAPDSFPPIHDDGNKPPHSYATLIGMSILRAPNRRLTLAQIYKWISDNYSFYGANDAGWQNSIRHNLSLNKAFIKKERPKDDPGKGNYWAIMPGMEHQFIKDKPSRKAASGGSNDNAPIMSAHPMSAPLPSLPDYPQSAVFKPLASAPQELPSSKPAYSLPEVKKPLNKEFSSDATIPDNHAEEEQNQENSPSSPLMRSSPPPMHSSPPVSRHVSRRNDTPPPVPRFSHSSANRSHKRKFASMDDSGYFSSLDSSALRGNRPMISEADRPRIKRGRAEEEIARLRGSSYDSPTKKNRFAPPSSSPYRQSHPSKNTSQMLPPLTPAVKLRAPQRPPPSVSPNTNLKMHREMVREMVGSPLRGVTTMDDGLPWSPAFNLDDQHYMFNDFSNGDFDIFNDNTFLSIPGNGSPEKRSAKRPRLDRARSANILAEISNRENANKTPSLKVTPSLAASVFGSPIRGFGLMDSPSKLLNLSSPSKVPSPNFNLDAFDLPNDEFFGNEFVADDDLNEYAGVDIMQGFQKIGAGGQTSRSTPKANSRPNFSRSFTSRF
ncbi:hypothetical protein HYFRA_00001422 [Hymenoscyphus fraxineus]|uniref:Fork-head domain-containing protein n=1 Tax=Hymenoscyphus fraxineus TaxID=746836 RepID=A0A9N9L6N6_9HELO|nr:hypothetical protein HYFRA_00001422 [Hymenoscyphus fraxineus]